MSKAESDLERGNRFVFAQCSAVDRLRYIHVYSEAYTCIMLGTDMRDFHATDSRDFDGRS
jgi:hypothetical protein